MFREIVAVGKADGQDAHRHADWTEYGITTLDLPELTTEPLYV
jgi:hypothetical protein